MHKDVLACRSKKQLAYVNSLTNFISASRPAPVRGGILADDMGLGKTLTVLCEPQRPMFL